MSKLCGMIVDSGCPVYDFNWLCERMGNRDMVSIRKRDGSSTQAKGVIIAINPESGSGKDWLVTLVNGLNREVVYVRTN